MFPHLQSKQNLELNIDWAANFWKAAAIVFPDNPWETKYKEERAQQRQESLAVSAVVFQALGLLGRDLLQEEVPATELGKWLAKLGEIDWRRDNEFWLERGVTQLGEAGKPIASNTKTTVNACHKVLREFVGVVSIAGAIA